MFVSSFWYTIDPLKEVNGVKQVNLYLFLKKKNGISSLKFSYNINENQTTKLQK